MSKDAVRRAIVQITVTISALRIAGADTTPHEKARQKLINEAKAGSNE